MSKTINEFVAEPYTTKLGDTINPGDRVVYVTHGYSVSMGKGWFDGVFKDSKGNDVYTRVRGVYNTKSVPSGKMIKYTYKAIEYPPDGGPYVLVDKEAEYPEYVNVPCEPHGTALLQRHRMIKIEG